MDVMNKSRILAYIRYKLTCDQKDAEDVYMSLCENIKNEERRKFAAQFMAAAMSSRPAWDKCTLPIKAKDAVYAADCLIEELNKKED